MSQILKEKLLKEIDLFTGSREIHAEMFADNLVDVFKEEHEALLYTIEILEKRITELGGVSTLSISELELMKSHGPSLEKKKIRVPAEKVPPSDIAPENYTELEVGGSFIYGEYNLVNARRASVQMIAYAKKLGFKYGQKKTDGKIVITRKS